MVSSSNFPSSSVFVSRVAGLLTRKTLTSDERTQMRQLSGRQKRCLMKHELLQIAPYCVHCGRQLVAQANRVNSGHLVRKRLSCPEHVKDVRKASKQPAEN